MKKLAIYFRSITRFARKGLILSGLILSLWSVIAATQLLSTPSLPSRKHPVRLYSNQLRQDLGLTLEKAIDRAKTSIVLSIYSLTDKRLIKHLRAQAEAGIAVTVICDAEASPRVAERLGPAVETTRREALGLMHQKILIIDSEEVWIGSANLTPSSLRRHGNLLMGLKSAEVAASLSEHLFALDQEEHEQPHRFGVGKQDIDIWVLPTDSQALPDLIKLIDGATSSVRVAMFTWTHPDLTDAMIRARKRGLEVEVVIDYQSGSGVSGREARRLQRHGVPVTLSDGMGLLHHKFAWVDEAILIHGSANWTRSAFGRNDEVMTVVKDLDRDQQRLMRRLWKVLCLESVPL